MKTDLVKIIGAGGHAKVILEILNNCFEINEIQLYDDDIQKIGKNFYGIKIISNIQSAIRQNDSKLNNLLVAIGDNKIRKKVVEEINQSTVANNFVPNWATVNGLYTTIAKTALIGEGTVVFNHANIGPSVKIGKHCIINNHSNVDHDCEIKDYVHIAPGAMLCGGVKIGEGTLIGAGSVIIPDIEIGSNLVIRAGSMVRKNLLTKEERDRYFNNF